MDSRENNHGNDTVDLGEIGSENKQTEKVNEGDKVAVNFLCENVKDEIVIDVVVIVKDKIDSEIDKVIIEVKCLRSARDWKKALCLIKYFEIRLRSGGLSRLTIICYVAWGGVERFWVFRAQIRQ